MAGGPAGSSCQKTASMPSSHRLGMTHQTLWQSSFASSQGRHLVSRSLPKSQLRKGQPGPPRPALKRLPIAPLASSNRTTILPRAPSQTADSEGFLPSDQSSSRSSGGSSWFHDPPMYFPGGTPTTLVAS